MQDNIINIPLIVQETSNSPDFQLPPTSFLPTSGVDVPHVYGRVIGRVAPDGHAMPRQLQLSFLNVLDRSIFDSVRRPILFDCFLSDFILATFRVCWRHLPCLTHPGQNENTNILSYPHPWLMLEFLHSFFPPIHGMLRPESSLSDLLRQDAFVRMLCVLLKPHEVEAMVALGTLGRTLSLYI